MKFLWFKKQVSLDPVESEVLKVALHDAWQFTEQQRVSIENTDSENPELAFLVTKLARLESLLEKLGSL